MSSDARNNRIDYIEFPAASVDALGDAKKFYENVFGWEYQSWAPTYADTQSSGITSGISVDVQERQTRPLPVIYVINLEATRGSVIEAGASITKDVFAFPGGRRFHFQDPAGNELAVWSDT